MKIYKVVKALNKPVLSAGWDESEWKRANELKVDNFWTRSSGHRPDTRAKLLYDDSGFHGKYLVKDRYVRAVHQGFQSMVCKDSCVEFFVQPPGIENKYMNFEFNCGGSFLVYLVTFDPAEKTGKQVLETYPLTPEDVEGVEVYHSLPEIVEPEISDPVEWTLAFHIPFGVFERFFGGAGDLPGRQWPANFYKCGNEVSHPHWATWNPVEEISFHLPRCFGRIEFE